MTQNEYFKISCRRGSFNKKGLLYVLVSFFELASIHHDEVNKTYCVASVEVAKLSQKELSTLSKLTSHFCHYDIVEHGFLKFKYALV